MDPIAAGQPTAWDLLGRLADSFAARPAWGPFASGSAADRFAAGPAAGRFPAGPLAAGPFAAGMCRTCRGPARHRGVRCFQCALHAECAPGSLASVVVPVAYAVKGGPLARSLWLYKSGRPGAQAAGHVLAGLLLVFLREHGRRVWRAAGWADGAGPTHVAVVPSSRGRTGPHPLRSLAEPCLRRPWAALWACPDAPAGTRDLDPGRFGAASLDGARVLLLDDTWTTGASAQSATIALRRAGAASVAVVVIGRHLALPRPGTGSRCIG